MGFFNKYPYLDEHELNLDWLLKRMKELDIRMDEFEVVNHISFSGIWDITKQYPAWTIVSDNNIGYVSIQPVPAGVLLTNGNYWRAVIDYTAQIAGLQSRVVNLENDMLTVQGDITSINGDITNLQTLTNRLANRHFIIMGDSYVGTSDFARKIIGNLGLDDTMTTIGTYSKVNSDGTGYIVATGGVGFTNKGNGPSLADNGFLEILQASENDITDHNDITDVVVIGGANDSFWSVFNPGVQSNMNDFADYVEATYPNAKLWLGFVARIRGTNPSNITSNNLISAYYNYSNNARFTYMHGIEYSLYITDSLLGADNMHPTTDGGTKIAEKAAQLLLGGNPVSSWTWADNVRNVVFDSAVGYSNNGCALAPKIIDGTHWHVDMPSFDWHPVNYTLNGEFSVTIGTQNAFYLNQPVDITLPGTMSKTSNAGMETINLTLELSGYDLILKGHLNEGVSYWTSHTNVNMILVFQTSFDIPLLYC